MVLHDTVAYLNVYLPTETVAKRRGELHDRRKTAALEKKTQTNGTQAMSLPPPSNIRHSTSTTDDSQQQAQSVGGSAVSEFGRETAISSAASMSPGSSPAPQLVCIVSYPIVLYRIASYVACAFTVARWSVIHPWF